VQKRGGRRYESSALWPSSLQTMSPTVPVTSQCTYAYRLLISHDNMRTMVASPHRSDISPSLSLGCSIHTDYSSMVQVLWLWELAWQRLDQTQMRFWELDDGPRRSDISPWPNRGS
jgi:hypothetical protein